MIRVFDIILSTIGLFLLLPVMFILYLIGLLETSSPLFIQQRLGLHRKTFSIIKFRTMRIGVKEVGTHLAKESDITIFGKLLRKSKLDETPQLINVLLGQMSFVGPRPGLTTQRDLDIQRTKRNIFDYKPGITGLAQINGVDMSTPKKISKYDQILNKNLDTCLYFKIIFVTLLGKGKGDRIKLSHKRDT